MLAVGGRGAVRTSQNAAVILDTLSLDTEPLPS